jgi:catabolite regulation protein CreA
MKTQLNCCTIWKSLNTYRVFDHHRVPAKFLALTRKIWRGTWAKAVQKLEMRKKFLIKIF